MHLEILPDQQKRLVPLVAEFGKEFYLVGGTALALQYGHRRSIDFDLFRRDEFDNLKIRRKVKRLGFGIDKVFLETEGQLNLVVDGVQMTWYRYDYEVELAVEWEGVIKMPDDLTIGAMKAFALGYRAKWKDYVDLYFILKKHGLRKVVAKAKSMYPEGEFDEKLLREQLAYYGDVRRGWEIEFMPGWEVSEEEVKRFLTEVAVS